MNVKGYQNILALVFTAIPWVLSAVLVVCLFLGMLYFQKTTQSNSESLSVRSVDIAAPPPPPPPPVVELEVPQADSSSPSIDLVGSAGGATMRYSDKPVLEVSHLEKIEKPEFNVKALDFKKALTLDFPTVDVHELDETPHAVSTVSVKYPSSLARRGIKRVPTQVELIIDQRGKAYVKKIVDPVYPEMIKPIRKWVSNVQFTVPTKNGRPIQAIYLYTLVFVYRI